MIKTYFYNHNENLMYHDVDLTEKDIMVADPENLLWIDLYDCSVDELMYVGEIFDFHPLALEDCLQKSPRAKVDHYDDGYSFFVFHALRYHEDTEDDEIKSIELDVFLGANYLVTIHPVALSAVGKCARNCLRGPDIMERGTDYLLYNIIDNIVDDYFPIMEALGGRIDDLEDEIFTDPAQEITEEILILKRTLLLLRKVIMPQRRIFANVNGRYSFPISEENRPYYIDLVDHLDVILDTNDTYRDLVNSAMDTHYSIVSSRTNEVIRTLTIISTIMMPLTFITSLYGMNVHIPAAGEHQYFWIILGGMGLLATSMMTVFRKKRWI
ncbi:MAG: magnesium/cobalt transporter CorA [Methanomassiliicoccales archaeon]